VTRARKLPPAFPRLAKTFLFPRGVPHSTNFPSFDVCVVCALCVLCVYFFSGCAARPRAATRQPPPIQPSAAPPAAPEAPTRDGNGAAALDARPAVSTEEGKASWYGAPFHGRRASNGEVYDMYKLTAAHRTLPFDTVVRVINLNNGKSTVVRITDRGPFVDNRIIDLSLAAAREIESVGPGVVPVRLEILSAIDPNSGFFTVQVGAFRDRANADRLRDRLSASYSPIFIQQIDTADGAFYRVRVGKIPGEDAAQQFGEQLRNREGFTPMIIRLDEGVPAGGSS
jgi:rare lipoprotein A